MNATEAQEERKIFTQHQYLQLLGLLTVVRYQELQVEQTRAAIEAHLGVAPSNDYVSDAIWGTDDDAVTMAADLMRALGISREASDATS